MGAVDLTGRDLYNGIYYCSRCSHPAHIVSILSSGRCGECGYHGFISHIDFDVRSILEEYKEEYE